jgi:Asp-tRNA(Asn)/Glu-tRNA(Gln) amidotransferase A subunit family amidase
MQVAEELDQRYATDKASCGPLHGMPVILKDNFNTADMPTTGACPALKDSMAQRDAHAVRKLRAAGALILAKANQGELARNGTSFSSLGGQPLNPYDLTRNPGGSSGGTGSSIAARFAVLGTGSDTGQSIRSPASACNLVGVRPTRGLIGRSGIMPNSFTQDEIGPITRTVADAALMLDVMAGYDPEDPITAFSRGRIPRSYTDMLDKDALRGTRIGVIENLFGTEERHQEVNRVMDAGMNRMAELGATLIRFRFEEFDTLSAVVGTSRYEAYAAWKRWFGTLTPQSPIQSLEQLVAANNCSTQSVLELELSLKNGLNDPTYLAYTLNRDKLRLALAGKMAELRLDAVLYPLQRILVPPVATGDQPERNGVLSNGTGFPAICIPMGFSIPTDTAPLGVPVGADLLGLDYTEPKLLAYAYAWEQAARLQCLPASTPALPDEP